MGKPFAPLGSKVLYLHYKIKRQYINLLNILNYGTTNKAVFLFSSYAEALDNVPMESIIGYHDLMHSPGQCTEEICYNNHLIG